LHEPEIRQSVIGEVMGSTRVVDTHVLTVSPPRAPRQGEWDAGRPSYKQPISFQSNQFLQNTLAQNLNPTQLMHQIDLVTSQNSVGQIGLATSQFVPGGLASKGVVEASPKSQARLDKSADRSQGSNDFADM